MVVDLSHHVEFLLLGRAALHLTVLVHIVGVVMLRSVATSLRPTGLTPGHPGIVVSEVNGVKCYLEHGIPLS